MQRVLQTFIFLLLLSIIPTILLTASLKPSEYVSLEINRNFNPVRLKTHYSKILIADESELATIAVRNGWNGEGTKLSPYIIENLNITTTKGTATGFNASDLPALEIMNTRSYVTIQNCYFSIAGSMTIAIKLTNTSNIVIRNNTLTRNSFCGIYVEYATNITIVNNDISSNSGGIRVMSTRNIIIENNSIIQNKGTALEILNMMDQSMNIPSKVDLKTNLLSSNSNGIFLSGFIEVDILMNIILNNSEQGIDIFSCINGTMIEIRENIIQGNRNGIFSERGKGFLIIEYNHFELNTHSDIFFGQALLNSSFHLNNFITTSIETNSYYQDNQWDNGTHGNFWGEYKGEDANQNGIGDSSYQIALGEEDRHPLMLVIPLEISFRDKVYTPDSLKIKETVGFELLALVTGLLCLSIKKRERGKEKKIKNLSIVFPFFLEQI
jgi:parallel beta-helix repeat protein